jgi:hypothetical protein
MRTGIAWRRCGHSGYVLPTESPRRLLPGYQGPSFHDWHHRSSARNYANLFIWFDRWFGTISPAISTTEAGGRARRSVGATKRDISHMALLVAFLLYPSPQLFLAKLVYGILQCLHSGESSGQGRAIAIEVRREALRLMSFA